jgi:Exo-beta-N-acetylmuramidase NamZ, C-terminal
VTNRAVLRPVRVGVEVASLLQKMYGSKFELDAAERLFGSKEGVARIRAGDDPATIAQSWNAGESRWRLLRNQYLIYR